MTLLMLNILLMTLGLPLVVGGLTGLAVVSGLPCRPARPPMARPARWAVAW